jgi:type I restriction enzyme M protein
VPSSKISETETVVKRILPYLRRRGYDIETDLIFEHNASDDHKRKFVDIAVCGKRKSVQFIVEAKRQSHRLTAADRKQALSYGKSVDVPFVVLTNGIDLELLNTFTGTELTTNGGRSGRSIVPHKSQLAATLRKLRANPNLVDLAQNDETLPYRPGLPLKQLNALFYRCHSKIRSLEKDEDSAFADFSKILFLRLLEEKSEDPISPIELPYSWRFHELAARPVSKADEVKTLVDSMILECRKKYGQVITEGLKIRLPRTYHYLVTELSKVSFTDSGLDTKGAAFEYFVRATLKGKRLGQYFTPRPLVEIMLELIGRDLIINSVASGEEFRVLDPACGTGGFLVFLMKNALEEVNRRHEQRALSQAAAAGISRRIMQDVFFGIDANPGVASSAKMNMIISGDGHTNIVAENSLAIEEGSAWSIDQPEYDLVISNPPFGTSESDLSADDIARYPIRSPKGQHLFLQHMILSTKPGGVICTVIDDGVLNNPGVAAELRRWMLQNAKLEAVVSLPMATFKPNKITVKTSVIVLRRFDERRDDPEAPYSVMMAEIDSLGYSPSGDLLRSFPFAQLRADIAALWQQTSEHLTTGEHWRAFRIDSSIIAADATANFDFKYWNAEVREETQRIIAAGGKTIRELNLIETSRGKSPSSGQYVDEIDGYAMVLKAGSSVTKLGTVVDSGDWIEKATYDEHPAYAKVQYGDVLLSSSGQGTLGKCGVYLGRRPAVADQHLTIIRVDPAVIDRHFLADYLRCGFGRAQTTRFYSGSTGLIELVPEYVDRVVVPTHLSLDEQRDRSRKLRQIERQSVSAQAKAADKLLAAQTEFFGYLPDAIRNDTIAAEVGEFDHSQLSMTYDLTESV